MNSKRCVLLPHKIGNGVIKISLDKSPSENARVILFVPQNGCVYEHSHDQNDNPDSEVYIDLLQMIKSEDKDVPEIAGSNSPTGTTKHSIGKKEEPQIILAIKKGQEKGIWEDLKSDFRKYFQELDVTCQQNEDTITITSGGTGEKKEVVTINTKRNSVIYFSQEQQEFVTLEGLQKGEVTEDKNLSK